MKQHPIRLKKRILLVDDQAATTNLWRMMLEEIGGYVVHEENRSHRAVKTARAFRPDLLLLDIDMPGMDGTDVARVVSSDVDLGQPAIVFLSSLVTARETSAGKRIDGHRCLPKPTCLADLVHAIEATLTLAC